MGALRLSTLTGEQTLLKKLREFAEAFAAQNLGSYTRRLKGAASISQTPKEINDPIWGTIKLTALEVLIVDCPLVQRLRFIRQLGVVHWVYPGASHARFEHTLGVLFQTQQLVAAINQASGEGPSTSPIDTNKAGLVRLCALLHDIGHGVFSHVSEHALAKRKDMRVALAEFSKENGLSKVQLSELIAYYFIGSPAFEEMLTVGLDRLGQPISFGTGAKQNAKQICAHVQSAIVGRMIDDEIPLLHELITGPFDADKLDYYIRDAKHAGVPSLLDISRLTQKIAVVRVASRDLPTQISESLTRRRDYHYLFGLKWSGAPILDELHLARVLLYAKIYRHKKVQAIEAMIDSLFDAIGSVENIDLCKLVQLCYEFSDDQLLWSKADILLKQVGIEEPPAPLERFVDSILESIRGRNLFVSALAVRPKYPSDPWDHDKKQSLGLTDIDADLGNTQKLRRFRDDLRAELASLATLVPEIYGGLDPETVALSITISAKPQLGGATEIDRAFIVQGEKVVAGRDLDRINQPAWATAYDFGSPSAIVFCPRECSAAVYIAAERMIRRQYNVVLPASALDLSKQDLQVVTDLKRRAEAAGWYSGTPLDIRPIPLRLTRLDIATRLDPIVEKLGQFDEPSIIIDQRRAPQLRDRVVSWLAQFRDDDMINGALATLEALRILRREDTHAALSKFVAEHPEFKGATICPLGASKDSGAVQAYISLDQPMFPRVSTVEQAASRNDEGPVIFLDDFTASGSQALDILGHWFGDVELTRPSLEEERLPFSDRERKYLRERKLAFVFVAGWDDGLVKIEEAISRLGLDAIVYAFLSGSSIPYAFSEANPIMPAEITSAFEKRCRYYGEELLRSEDRASSKITERALGYGNKAMLLASGLNVPTQTLTCLWKDGTVDGVDWHALLRRRNKK